MSEVGFQLFNRFFSLGAELLNAGCLAFLFQPLLPGRQHRRRLAAVFFAYLLGHFLCVQAAAPQGTFGILVALLLIAAARFLAIERSLVFLLTMLYWNARISGGLVAQSLYFLVERALPFPIEPPEIVFLRAAVLVTLFLLTYMLLLVLMLCALRRRLLARRMTLCRGELCYLSLVPMAGILFGQMISRLLIEFQDGVLLQLYQRHPAFLAVVPLMALLFYGGAYLTIAFQQGMTALREEQATHYMEYQQALALRARIRETEDFYLRIRGLKHELRGHLTNLKGLAHVGEYASLEDYIARMDESIGDFELALQTGNPVTDVIVNDIRQQCIREKISFQTDFRYPGPGYDAFDLGIILQNLLQNALEACGKVPEGQRSVTLTGQRKGRFFLIEVQNPFAGEVVFGPDGLPVTTKAEDPAIHGIGLANVRREVEKYMGELELKADRQEFSAAVLLQERSSLS